MDACCYPLNFSKILRVKETKESSSAVSLVFWFALGTCCVLSDGLMPSVICCFTGRKVYVPSFKLLHCLLKLTHCSYNIACQLQHTIQPHLLLFFFQRSGAPVLIALKSQTKDEWHAIDLLSSVVIAVAVVVIVVVVI